MSVVPCSPGIAPSGLATPLSSLVSFAPGTPTSSPTKAASIVATSAASPPAEGENRCSKCDQFGLAVIQKITKESHQYEMVKTTTNPRCKTFDHVVCKRNYGGLCRRWGSDLAVKMWWTSKSDEEKTAWYVSHLGVASSQGSARPIEVERFDSKAAGVQNNDMDNYIPYKVFKRNCLSEGKVVAEIDKEWLALLRDESVNKVEKRGEVFVYDSTVLQVNRFDNSQTGYNVKAVEQAPSAEALDAHRSSGQEDLQRFKRRRDSKAPASSEVVPRPLGGARGCMDLDSSLVEADSLDLAMAAMTEEQMSLLSLVQELADIDEQDIQIFRVEKADEIKAKTAEKPLDQEVRKAHGKMQTFLKGTFDTKVESTIAEALDLARNCEANYPKEAEVCADWRSRIQQVKTVKESLVATRGTFEEMVVDLSSQIDKATAVAQVEKAMEEFDKSRLAHFTAYKSQAEHVTKMTALVKKKEQKLRDEAGHSTKRKKNARKTSQVVGEQGELELVEVTGNAWDGILTFLYNSFASANPSVNIKPLAEELIGISACKVDLDVMGTALRDMPVLKALFKWCESQCTDGLRSAMAASMSQASHRAKLETVVGNCTKMEVMRLFARPFIASDPGMQEVFVPQAVFYTKGQSSLSLAPFGLPVAFVPVDGNCIVGGLNLAGIPGETLSAKTEHIKRLSIEALTDVLKLAPIFLQVESRQRAHCSGWLFTCPVLAGSMHSSAVVPHVVRS